MNPIFPLLLAANKYRIWDVDFPTILPGSLNIATSLLIVLGLIIAVVRHRHAVRAMRCGCAITAGSSA